MCSRSKTNVSLALWVWIFLSLLVLFGLSAMFSFASSTVFMILVTTELALPSPSKSDNLLLSLFFIHSTPFYTTQCKVNKAVNYAHAWLLDFVNKRRIMDMQQMSPKEYKKTNRNSHFYSLNQTFQLSEPCTWYYGKHNQLREGECISDYKKEAKASLSTTTRTSKDPNHHVGRPKRETG